MELAHLQAELIDFMEGRGRFTARSEYVGMAASSHQELFIHYYQRLDDPDRHTMVRLLADAAVGHNPVLALYTLPALSLLLRLGLQQFHADLRHVQAQLAQVLHDPEHLAQWLQADDRAELPGDRSFQQDWHYALMLWGVLYLLDPASVTAVYRRLSAHAHSARFRQALVRAKMSYDQLGEMA